MEYTNLPIVGRVQHGEKVGGRAKEYGHFILKTQDVQMQVYSDRFDKLFKGKQSIDITIFNEEPLAIKYARFNQGGEACHCKDGETTANLKSKNGWQQIKCDTFNCQYRQRNEQGKMACNRMAWFKFMIPSICKDRIFLMRITGQTSIDALDDYFKLQKAQGNSIKGNYTIFLKQKEQSNILCQTFNNYVLDILKKDNFNSEETIPQNTEKTNKVHVEDSKSESKNVENQQKTATIPKKTDAIVNESKGKAEKKPKIEKTNKTSEAKVEKMKTKKSENISKNEESKKEKNEYANYYILDSTDTEKLKSKDGTEKDYVVGKFYDMNNKISNIVIRPEHAKELVECDLGTVTELDVQERLGMLFAINLKFIDKRLKKIAA